MAVIADLVTSAERGKYMAYASLGFTLAPVLGPSLGGIFTHFLGWRSIFVFLAIFAAVLTMAIFVVMPETCRAIVDNGSIRPQRWNQSCWQYFWSSSSPQHEQHIPKPPRRHGRPSMCDSCRIIRNPPNALIIFAGMLILSGYMAILISIPSLFAANYGFNSLQIGLCYLPYAAGGLVARWTVGWLADGNFRRISARAGVILVHNRQTPHQLQLIPLERARLQLTLPLLYASVLLLALLGWLLKARVHIAVVLLLFFLLGITLTGVQNMLNMLLIDINGKRPATATATNMLFRSLAAAGVVAATLPLIQRTGVGWTATIIAGVWVIASCALWTLWMYGKKWRDQVGKPQAQSPTTAKENNPQYT